MKTTAPLVAAWAEHMNGQLPHANKLALHYVDADGNIVRDQLPPEATDFCGNDGKRCFLNLQLKFKKPIKPMSKKFNQLKDVCYL